MRFAMILGLGLLTATCAACGGGGGSGNEGGPPRGIADFLHFTRAENLSGRSTVLDHPLANGNPSARIFVTHNYNPGGGSTGDYYDAHVGLSYDSGTGRWSIADVSGASMQTGIYFNVAIISGFSSAWTHVAEPGSVFANATVLDHPTLNDAPSALALVSKNLTPPGVAPPLYSVHAHALSYDSGSWHVLLQNPGSSMNPTMAFNVHAMPHDADSSFHVADATNIVGNRTFLAHAGTAGNRELLIQVTPRLEGGVYSNRAIGIWYDTTTRRWEIFNEDRTPMPIGAAFVIRVKPLP